MSQRDQSQFQNSQSPRSPSQSRSPSSPLPPPPQLLLNPSTFGTESKEDHRIHPSPPPPKESTTHATIHDKLADIEESKKKIKTFFSDTKSFLQFVLHTDYQPMRTDIERLFVMNCISYGFTYFNFIYTVLCFNGKSTRAHLKNTVDEEILNLLNLLLDTYIVEYFVKNTLFGKELSLNEMINFVCSYQSIDLIEFVYDKCQTSAETNILLTKIFEALRPGRMTQFEIGKKYAFMCTWNKFRRYLVEHSAWCYTTLRENDMSILSNILTINFTKNTFNRIMKNNTAIINVFSQKNTFAFMEWLSTIITLNKFRLTDQWIMGMRMIDPIDSSSEIMLLNLFYSFCQISSEESESLQFEAVEKCVNEDAITWVTAYPKESLFVSKCDAFEVIIYTLIKKLEYSIQQQDYYETTIAHVINEYSNNEASQIINISSKLVKMFKSRLMFLSQLTEINKLFVYQLKTNIRNFSVSVLKWLYANRFQSHNIFRDHSFRFMKLVDKILYVLNYMAKAMNSYCHFDDNRDIISLCIHIISLETLPLHFKTNCLMYIEEHAITKDTHLRCHEMEVIWKHYCSLRSDISSEEMETQKKLIVTIYNFHVNHYQSVAGSMIFPDEINSLIAISIINHLTQRFESFRDNYEYILDTFYSTSVLSVNEISNQRKCEEKIREDIFLSLKLLHCLRRCYNYPNFREKGTEPDIADKLCECLVFIFQYCSTRFSKTYSIVGAALENVVFMLTFPEFSERFIRACGTDRPQSLVHLQKMIKNDSKNIQSYGTRTINKNMSDNIKNIFTTLKFYTEKLLDYDTIPESLLDPLMYTLITDPVLLPHSTDDTPVFMDRVVITRYLQNSSENPFTREELTLEDLETYNNSEKAQEHLTDFRAKLKSFQERAAATTDTYPTTETTPATNETNESNDYDDDEEIEDVD